MGTTEKSPVPGGSLAPAEKTTIEQAVEAGARVYFARRRERIRAFVDRHFSMQGTLRMHRQALGGDLVRAPANLMWAVPYLITRSAAMALHKFGAGSLAQRLARVPPGFRTRVQREIEWLVHTDLLELPFAQDDRRYDNDALLAAILAQPGLSALLLRYLDDIRAHANRPEFERRLREQLGAYGGARVAVADLACGVISMSVGATVFHKMTPGALSTGSAFAAAIAQQSAISGFVFGPSLGSIYYSLFPATASAGLVAASTGGVLAAMGLVSAFSGVVTDPIQTRLGIHQRRLCKLIDTLEAQFISGSDPRFHPKEAYVARIFDLVDLLKTAAVTVLR